MNQVLSWGVHAPRGRPLTALPAAPTPRFSGASLLLLPLGLAPALEGRKPLHPQPCPALAWPGLVTLALSLPCVSCFQERTQRRPFSTPSRCLTPKGKVSSRLICKSPLSSVLGFLSPEAQVISELE